MINDERRRKPLFTPVIEPFLLTGRGRFSCPDKEFLLGEEFGTR